MNSAIRIPSHPPVAERPGSRWHASLALQFRHGTRGTRLIQAHHSGPLYVQRPFYPEGADLAHVYLLHPPGGIVSGDRLQIRLHLQSGASVLCTTPGAGRVYRAREDCCPQEQHNHLRIAAGCSLEWFPQETIIFPGAHTCLQTQVHLESGAVFCGWEITVLGLPANGLAFDAGQLRQQLHIAQDGRPVVIENLVLGADTPGLYHAAAGLRSQPVNGIFVCGPFTADQLAMLDIGALQALAAAPPSRAGITRLGDFLVARFLGDCAQEARRCFVAWWTLLRPMLLQRPVCCPAIWST